MYGKKLSIERRTIFSKVIPAIAFGILLFFLFTQTAIAADPAGAVLIIDDDNDVYFEDDQSVDVFQSAFEDIGYNVTIEKSVKTLNSTWTDYDIVVWSCGDDLTPLRHETYLFNIVENAKKVEDDLNTGIISEALKDKFKTDGFPISEDAVVTKETDDKWVITVGERIYFVKREDIGLNIYLYSETKNMLVDYVTDGGYLILEGGNIAWECRAFTAFAAKVLHIPNEFVYSDVGNLTLSTQHPIVTTPNALLDTIGFTPTKPGDDSGDADAVRILPDATGVHNWSYVGYKGKPAKESVARISYGLIAYDNDLDVTNGGQIVYYAFDIDDIDDPEIQRKLIENSANWLREVPGPTPTPTTPTPTLTPTTPTPTPTPPAKAVLIINDDNDVYFEDDQSVGIFQSAFEGIGYDVKIEKSDETSYSTWRDYDLIVWSCGDDLTPAHYIEYREMLVDYVTEGGHLILESGHISTWNKRFGDQAIDYELRKKVLQASTDWVYCDVGNLTLSTQHPITTTPNALPDTMGFTPTKPGDDSGDADAVRILPDATGVYNWSYVGYKGKPVKESVARVAYGLIAYDNDADVTNGGQIIYYAFDIDDIDNPDIQRELIENSESWLKPPVKKEILPPTPSATPITPSPTPTTPGFGIAFAILGLLIAVYFRIRKRI